LNDVGLREDDLGLDLLLLLETRAAGANLVDATLRLLTHLARGVSVGPTPELGLLLRRRLLRRLYLIGAARVVRLL